LRHLLNSSVVTLGSILASAHHVTAILGFIIRLIIIVEPVGGEVRNAEDPDAGLGIVADELGVLNTSQTFDVLLVTLTLTLVDRKTRSVDTGSVDSYLAHINLDDIVDNLVQGNLSEVHRIEFDLTNTSAAHSKAGDPFELLARHVTEVFHRVAHPVVSGLRAGAGPSSGTIASSLPLTWLDARHESNQDLRKMVQLHRLALVAFIEADALSGRLNRSVVAEQISSQITVNLQSTNTAASLLPRPLDVKLCALPGVPKRCSERSYSRSRVTKVAEELIIATRIASQKRLVEHRVLLSLSITKQASSCPRRAN
ncbi:hypothetical protein KCV06_g192, partial [Aureobasidium melanogenum]